MSDQHGEPIVEKNRLSMRLMTLGFGVGLLAIGMLQPELALAGDSGGSDGDFEDIWDTLVDWSQGTLGRTIALAFVLVGLVRGIAQQSVMAFALGVGAGLGLYNAETIVDSIMGATVEPAAIEEAAEVEPTPDDHQERILTIR